LVSVRNPEEAQAALRGSAEILDIKEPSRGSLGKAGDDTIAATVRTVRNLDATIPISAALGELHEWHDAPLVPRLPRDIGIVKVGLALMADDRDWKSKWRTFRERFESANHAPAWVMVAYADWQKATAPCPIEVIEAADSLQCGIVLIDTFAKEGRSLVEILPEKELAEIGRAVHRRKLILAVAGSLRKADLSRIQVLEPEIVAIRSAACRAGQREGSLCPVAVREFRDVLEGKPRSETFI
jgi:uncharacterized protein (UPF0264 family)